MQADSEPDADSFNGLSVLVLLLFIMIMAFFSAAETAVLTANKNKMKYLADNSNKKAKLVLYFNENENKFLLTTQQGFIFSSFFVVAYLTINISNSLSGFITKINIPFAEIISITIIAFVLVFVIMVFGVLFPKRVANRFADGVALFCINGINLTRLILKPLSYLLTSTTELLVKITKLEKNFVEDKISEDEIISIIETGVSDGSIDYDEQMMIESVFKFNDLEAMDVMTPRVDVMMIDLDDELEEYIDEIIDGKYTRIPIYRGYKDNIVGIINIKDVLKQARIVGFDKINIESIVRKPLFVPESIKINVLFKKMKDSKNHMAILSDQYGGFVGIVTLEDLIEEIMGEIDDEFDDSRKPVIKINSNSYIANAGVPIQDLNRLLDLEFEEDNENYDTLGGLILMLLDRIPDENEKVSVEYSNIVFTVIKMDSNRIEKVRIDIK